MSLIGRVASEINKMGNLTLEQKVASIYVTSRIMKDSWSRHVSFSVGASETKYTLFNAPIYKFHKRHLHDTLAQYNLCVIV